MAAPYDQSQGQGYPQDQYAQQSPSQPGFSSGTTSPPPPPGQAEHEGGKKKKRGYAAQAYDFGGGANSALGGQTQGGGQFPPAQVPAYGGYQAVAPEQQPAFISGAPQYGVQPGAPVQGIPPVGYNSTPSYGGGVGYQAPDAGYQTAPGPAPGGVAGITQGMGQMGVGGPQGASQAGARPAVLNQLFPTDLLNQPFNVAELELPPPPIILPANVSL